MGRIETQNNEQMDSSSFAYIILIKPLKMIYEIQTNDYCPVRTNKNIIKKKKERKDNQSIFVRGSTSYVYRDGRKKRKMIYE